MPLRTPRTGHEIRTSVLVAHFDNLAGDCEVECLSRRLGRRNDGSGLIVATPNSKVANMTERQFTELRAGGFGIQIVVMHLVIQCLVTSGLVQSWTRERFNVALSHVCKPVWTHGDILLDSSEVLILPS